MSDTSTPTPPNPNILPTPIAQEMQESYLTYAMSVIMARALPDVRDGLKPSQRRILVAMHDLNLRPGAKHRKCAKICGDTSGNYHPHGESVIYPTLVRMAQEWSMRHPLIDPQGNFGSIDDDPPAAMRYTEARFARPADDMLADIDKETVDFEPNYDGTRTEPLVLPGKFPNLLINGSEGIAVGMATRLLPHNLAEICDAVIELIDRPDLSDEELFTIVPGPDFPTGAVIHGQTGVRQALATGRGSITVRGVMHTEDVKGGRVHLVIDEIPYGVTLATIKDRINDAVQAGNIKGIDDMRDESGREKLVRLVIELKRDANIDVVRNQLWEYTPLQTNIHALNIVLVNRVPRTLGLRQLIGAFVDHRTDVIRRRTQFLLRKARQRAHILEGLILAVADIDEIIELIKTSPNVEVARKRLMAKALRLSEQATVRKLLPEAFVIRATTDDQFLSHTQADAILAMQLRRLTGLEIEQLADEYTKLTEEIADLEMILSDDRLILDIIAEDMRELKEKYGEPRRTRIEGAIGDMSMDELIAQEKVIVSISHQGYIKRVPIDTYRSQGRGGRGVKGTAAADDDFIEHIHTCSTHDFMLFFTNRGRIYWLRVYDIPSMNRTARGRSLANLVTMQASERHMAVLPVSKFEEDYVFFATEKGVVKKTPLSAFSNPRPSGIQAITLDPDDTLIGVGLTSGNHEIVIGTRLGMACRFNEDDVRPMGRSARGVWGIDLAEGDKVVEMAVINPGMSLLTVCEKGMGKKTEIEEYRLTKRGAKGVINVKITDRNGPVVALKAVAADHALMLITSKGVLLRMSVDQMRDIGRATQGVKLIRVEDDDKVVAVARVIVDKDENGGIAAGGEALPPQDDDSASDGDGAAATNDGPDSGGDGTGQAGSPAAEE